MTQYQQAGGRFMLRATTIGGGWHSDPNSLEPLVRGYDQQAAAVLMARIAVHRTETEEVRPRDVYYPYPVLSGSQTRYVVRRIFAVSGFLCWALRKTPTEILAGTPCISGILEIRHTIFFGLRFLPAVSTFDQVAAVLRGMGCIVGCARQ